MDAMDKINMKIDKLRNKGESTTGNGTTKAPVTIQHATSEICLEGADILSRDVILQNEVPAGRKGFARKVINLHSGCVATLWTDPGEAGGGTTGL